MLAILPHKNNFRKSGALDDGMYLSALLDDILAPPTCKILVELRIINDWKTINLSVAPCSVNRYLCDA